MCDSHIWVFDILPAWIWEEYFFLKRGQGHQGGNKTVLALSQISMINPGNQPTRGLRVQGERQKASDRLRHSIPFPKLAGKLLRLWMVCNDSTANLMLIVQDLNGFTEVPSPRTFEFQRLIY